MSRPKEHVHITFLIPWIVFVGILGFKSLTNHYERPCMIIDDTRTYICNIPISNYVIYGSLRIDEVKALRTPPACGMYIS